MRKLKIDRRIAAVALAAAAAASAAAAAAILGFGGGDANTTSVTETTFQQLVPTFQADDQGGSHVTVWEHLTEKTYEVRETEALQERRLVDTVETRRLAGEGSWPADYVAAARANGWGLDQLSACTAYLLPRPDSGRDGDSAASTLVNAQCRTLASGIVSGDFESLRERVGSLVFDAASP